MGRAGQKGNLPRGITIRTFQSVERIAVSFQYKGERCRETLEMPPTPANIKWADATLNEIRGKIVRGTFNYADYFPNSPRAGKTANMETVGQLLDRFIKENEQAVSKGNVALSTLDGYRKYVRQLKDEFGKLAIHDLTAARIRDWVKSLGLTAKSVRNYLTPLRAVVADALNDELIDADPFNKVALDRLLQKHANKSEYVVDPFTPDEVAAICAAAEGQARNLIEFGFHTGLRTSEIVALRWEDVDFKARVVRVQRAVVLKAEKTPKTRAGKRNVELDAVAYAALEKQRQWTLLQGGRVFHSTHYRKPLNDDQTVREYIWRPVIKRSGVRYRNPYQMRHTYASTQLSSGVNPWKVAEQMGHEDLEMIWRVYGKWIPEVDDRRKRHGHA